jgi:hypothetical protein
VEGKINHLGIDQAPNKSTLAYANAHRPWQLFQRVFEEMYQRCQQIAPKHRLRFKNPLLSIDATVIELCASLFDWAHYKQTKGAVKLHMILDHNGLLPSFCHITEARKYDVTVAREWEFSAGTIIVFDRGYTDFRWFRSLDQRGIFFVTRLKRGTLYEVVQEHSIPKRGGVLRDATIRLTSRQLKGGSSPLLRLVEYRAQDGRTYEFLTNHLKFGPTTIAAIYEQRWQIELFQGHQTEPAHQNLRGDVGECSSHPGLDGSDRHPHPSLLEAPLHLRLGSVESSRDAPLQSLQLPRSVALAQRPVPITAAS